MRDRKSLHRALDCVLDQKVAKDFAAETLKEKIDRQNAEIEKRLVKEFMATPPKPIKVTYKPSKVGKDSYPPYPVPREAQPITKIGNFNIYSAERGRLFVVVNQDNKSVAQVHSLAEAKQWASAHIHRMAPEGF